MRAATIALTLLLAGCNLTFERDLAVEDTLMIARTRRAQVIAEIERLNVVLQRTRVVDNRIVLQAAINSYQSELIGLNSLLRE
jgi:hypothetical protein